MINKKIYKHNIKHLKKLFKESTTYNEIKTLLCFDYLRITNRHDFNFDKQYSYKDVLYGKRLKHWKQKLSNHETLNILFIKYDNITGGFIINVDYMNEQTQTIDSNFYVLSQEREIINNKYNTTIF